MLTQKTTKAKASSIAIDKEAGRITDRKTKRKYKKMFKDTTRRKQRIFEKEETKRIVNEYHEEQELEQDESIYRQSV